MLVDLYKSYTQFIIVDNYRMRIVAAQKIVKICQVASGVWKVSGGFWKLSGGCLKGVWRGWGAWGFLSDSGYCLEGYDMQLINIH